MLERLRAADGDAPAASEETVNNLGYALLGRGRDADAIAVLEVNARAFPRSANALDSLAEVCAKSGDRARAATLYARALAIDPKYPNAEFARAFRVAER